MEIREFGRPSRGHVALVGEWDPCGPDYARLHRAEVARAARDGRGVVLTLDPSPAAYVFGARARPSLDDAAARLHAQERCGVPARATVALTEVEGRRCGAGALLDELCARFPIDELVLGARQSLGVGTAGAPDGVRRAAEEHGVTVRRLEPVATRPRTADARRAVARGRLRDAVAIVGHELYRGRPDAGPVLVPWPSGRYRAQPMLAPEPDGRADADEVEVQVRDADGTGVFDWPDDSVPWLGFRAGPLDPA